MTTTCMMPMLHQRRSSRVERSTSERPKRPRHKLVRFAGIGGVATGIQLGLFAALMLFLPQMWANLISWTVSTLIANAVNRSVTFGVHGSDGARRDLLVSTGFSVVSLLASLSVLGQIDTENPLLSVLALVAVNAVVGLARFAGLRWWFVARPAAAHA